MGLEVFNPFAGLLGEKQQQDSWRWGTVVATSPLRVQLDGDSTPLTTPPDTLVPVLTGDRVRVHMHNRRATIMGRTGNPTAYPAANTIRIGGQNYALSGRTWNIPPITWDSADPPVYRANIEMPVPYTPPDGYSFTWNVAHSIAAILVGPATYNIVGGTQRVRVLQLGTSSTGNLSSLGWQLVKA